MAFETMRMIERMIIACGGIISITLGYRLFMMVPAEQKPVSGGSFRSAWFSLSLSKVGPGVFFALFGAYVLVTGINTKIEWHTAGTVPTKDQRPAFDLVYQTALRLPDSEDKQIILRLVANMRADLPSVKNEGGGTGD